jgi:hypothetical protein
MIAARLNFRGNFISEKIAMAYDQTYGKPHLLLGDDALSGIAAGFDDDLAHLFAKKYSRTWWKKVLVQSRNMRQPWRNPSTRPSEKLIR